MRKIVVFTGSAHPDLAESICSYLGVTLSPTTITRFSNGCLQVQLNENCRETDVFIIQPLVPPVHEHLMELLQMLDAARGASANSTATPRARTASVKVELRQGAGSGSQR